MKLSKLELISVGVVFVLFVISLFVFQAESTLFSLSGREAQTAATVAAMSADDAIATVQSGGQVDRLIINDIERGTGAIAQAGDRVRVHYEGRLPDGTQFDSSRDRGEPFSFVLGQGRVIAGWEEGVQGMREGGKRILVIPPDLAYGDRVVGLIPAGSTLVFTIELLSVE